MNSFGRIFKLTTFGESHGKAIGGVVDGMPPGIDIDVDFIQDELNRRRPGQSPIVSQRSENDHINIISGVFEGKSTGAPIAFFVENEDQRPADYDDMSTVYRPSHADFTYHKKYGIRDYRGGGRSSARITISRVVAGALAKLVLRRMGITIRAFTKQIGDIELDSDYTQYDIATSENNIVRCPDKEKASQMIELIKRLREEGDTTGGVVSCVIKGCKAGLGEPEFGKLHAALGAAMLSINAAKAFEIGDGWRAARSKGSEMNDVFVASNNISQPIRTATNHSGGIMGGISNGEDIFFNVAFKPIATISIEQKTCNYEGQQTTIRPSGRHDVCVVPRAVAIVESMAAITILDYVLLDRAKKNI